MSKVPFDPARPSATVVRQIVLERLKRDPSWNQLEGGGDRFDPFVEYQGRMERGLLHLYVREVFWQLVHEGILAPGLDGANLDLPFFRLTDYGRHVIDETDPSPHDPTGYLDAVKRKLSKVDDTVMAYLTESIGTFTRGSTVAAVLLLGVAAERVFNLVCESMTAALRDPNEASQLKKLLAQFPIKPRLDWMHAKLQSLQKQRLPGVPENSALMITVLYELLRSQRNEVGHPREKPPVVAREDAFANLVVFPSYYRTAEELRDYLAGNKV